MNGFRLGHGRPSQRFGLGWRRPRQKVCVDSELALALEGEERF